MCHLDPKYARDGKIVSVLIVFTYTRKYEYKHYLTHKHTFYAICLSLYVCVSHTHTNTLTYTLSLSLSLSNSLTYTHNGEDPHRVHDWCQCFVNEFRLFFESEIAFQADHIADVDVHSSGFKDAENCSKFGYFIALLRYFKSGQIPCTEIRSKTTKLVSSSSIVN